MIFAVFTSYYNKLKISKDDSYEDYISLPLFYNSKKNQFWLFQKKINQNLLRILFTHVVSPNIWSINCVQQRKKAFQFMKLQVSWSLHLGFSWIILPPIPSLYVNEYRKLIEKFSQRTVFFLIPVCGTLQSWRDWNSITINSKIRNLKPSKRNFISLNIL